MFDLGVIGDTTLDEFLILDKSEAFLRQEDNQIKLCLMFGKKIPISAIHQFFGGNAYNVSMGASRLGIKTSLVTCIGANITGQALTKDLKINQISLSFSNHTAKANNNHSVILIYQGERTILTYHEDLEYDFEDLPECQWYYLTSLRTKNLEIYQPVLKTVQETQAKLVFQPGTFQIRQGLESLKPILAQTEVFLANKDEYQILLNEADLSSEKLLMELTKYGPRLAVLTENIKGASVYDLNAKKIFQIPALVSDNLLDPTGAGDAFAAAFVSGLIQTRSISQALQWSAVNSKSVVEAYGSTKNLLTKEEIIHFLRSKSAIEVKEKIT